MSMMNCQNCGEETYESAGQCPRCGTELEIDELTAANEFTDHRTFFVVLSAIGVLGGIAGQWFAGGLEIRLLFMALTTGSLIAMVMLYRHSFTQQI